MGRSRAIRTSGQQDFDGLPRSETVPFAHYSERQFARLLDFYQIEWDYEPRSFDIDWDPEGNVVQRFTPDFYLPDYDLYLEVTKAPDANKRLPHLNAWKEKYPESDFKEQRLLAYLTTYQQLNQPAKMIETSKEILALNPKQVDALMWLAYFTLTQPPTPDSLATVLRSSPVATFRATTVAPGITAPVGSVMVPSKRAVDSCADNIDAKVAPKIKVIAV